MWLSNRKNAYKVHKQFNNGRVDLISQLGVLFHTTQLKLDANNYKIVVSRPSFLPPGGFKYKPPIINIKRKVTNP